MILFYIVAIVLVPPFAYVLAWFQYMLLTPVIRLAVGITDIVIGALTIADPQYAI